jgi:hypothetical protein
MPNDTEPDPKLRRALMALGRGDTLSATFTDRVLLDLARHGLVRPAGARTARWWALGAAAAVVFATGLGVGAAIGSGESSTASAPPAQASADRAAHELNVPRVGQTEVWF